VKILPIFIPNSGCPGGCVFCDQSLNSGVSQAPTPQEVILFLQRSVPEKGLDQIAFYGGSFTALPVTLQDSYLLAVQPYLRSGQIAGIRISTRPDKIERESVFRLRRLGVETVELGCQSFSDEVLAASGRGCCSDGYGVAVRLLRDVGMGVGIQLMPGLPGATDDEARDSLSKALLLKPDFLRIYPTVVLAGTRLASDWREGRYLPLGLNCAVELCADLALISHEAGVPVLRFGLQASHDLDSGAVLAGPYHPAFGQLVQSCLWLRVMTRLMVTADIPVLQVHPQDFSTAVGQKRSNLKTLTQQHSGLSIVFSDTVKRGYVRVDNKTVEVMAFAAGNG
jgi:histone acetyltransferase (RNA polymerase elongator complex component)